MSLKNSEFRAYATAAQQQQSSGSSLLIGVAIVAMLGLVGLYAYKIGFFSRGRPAVAAAAPAAPVPVAAQATKAAPAAPAAPPAVAVAAPSLPTRVDPRDATDALGSVVGKVLESNSNLLRRFDYMESFEGALRTSTPAMPPAPGSKPPPARRVDPNDLIASCTADLKEQLRDMNARAAKQSKALQDLAVFNSMSEIAACSIRRGQAKLCERKQRDQVLAQLRFYDNVRSDVMKVAANDAHLARLLAAAFDMGVHGDISRQVKEAGRKGFLRPSDFSTFPSRFVTDALGEFKAVKFACG